MANDIYGSTKQLAGTFKGTVATLTIASADAALTGSLVQNLSFNYNRQVTRLFEIGSENQYFIIGSSEGQGQIGSILGPSNIVVEVLNRLGDACKASENVVAFLARSEFCAGRRSTNVGLRVVCYGALLTGVNVGITAQDFLVQQGGQFMFTAMTLR